MEFTRNFTNLGRNDAGLAGGKGASLGEMTQAGIPVPPGFVVLADTFEQFIKETDLIQEIDAILATVDHKEIHTVESASEKIQALIKNAQTPEDIKSSILKDFDTLGTEFVAVRSSATAEDGQDHAWAGQLDSYLNVTRDTVLEKVQHCWASLFTPRAIFYRFEKGLDTTKISVAVVVQKMVNSEVSGIAFSVHPVTEDRNQLIIEAGYGLGEAIVSGQITPDSYVVEKEPRNILDINVSEQSRGLFRKAGGGNEWKELGEQGEKQVLTGPQINELSDIIVGIENHYGFPCDIEWAFEQGKFYIVQSRPITTLSHIEPPTEEVKKKISFNSEELENFDVYDYRYFGLWKNDILSSAFWQDCHDQDTLNKLGLSMKETGCLSLYGGHFLVKESLCNEVEKQIAEKILEGDKQFFENVKLVTDSILQASVEYGKTIPGTKVTVENVEKLFTELRKVNFILYLGASHLVNAAEKVLSDAVVEEKFPAEYVLDIIPPVVSPLSIQQKEVLRLKKIIGDRSFEEVKKDTELIKELDEHAKKYSWIEILNLVGDLVTTERLFEQIQHTKEVKEVEEKSIPQISDSLKFKAWAMYICGYVKQVSAEYFSMLTADAYYFLRDIANELNLEYRQFTLLCPKEIIAGLKGEISKEELKAKALSRRDLNWLLFVPENNVCSVVEDKEDVEKLKDSMLPKIDESAVEIRGVTAYPGKIRGVARIVMNRDEFDKMQTGDILVSTMTTPDFVILMQQASAIVTDIGGLLCHAAIVSREIHKPCIIGTKVATQVIKDGDIVEVDADNGVIRIIK